MGDPGGSVLYMVGAFLILYFAGVLVWLAARAIGRLWRRRPGKTGGRASTDE